MASTSSPTLISPPTPKLTPLSTPTHTTTLSSSHPLRRRHLISSLSLTTILFRPLAALAEDDEEYVKETESMITRVKSTINMDKNDPNVAAAVAELRDASNSWVAKYRREKSLLGRASFRDMYSALNAVSGHYISFGPTAPIPAKRRARILEEVETAEKALQRGR
ncbi:Photosystem II repair protein PSB27-H1, chloroplastic-like protein [Drosera capensis]